MADVERFVIDAGADVLVGEQRAGGGPSVVLLHAGVGDRRSWREVAVLLARAGRDVISYDRRGFGDSASSGEDFTHLEDLERVLDATTEGPVVLVGSSMGGLLAIDAALTMPERLTRLALISPAVSGEPEGELEDLDPVTRDTILAMREAGERGDAAAVAALEVRLWLDGPGAAEGRVQGEARELALDMSATVLRHGLADEAGQSDLRAYDRLEEIAVPTILSWGDLDVPDIIALSGTLAGRLPDVRDVHVFAGTGHLPYLERPAEVADWILRA